MIKLPLKIVCVILLGMASCQIPSRAAMEGEGGRTAYNVAIQMTNSQQMLLNLIRLRYSDSPLFLDVSSITTQSTFRSDISSSFPLPGLSKDHPCKLGADISWQDQPTITYSPLEGHAFTTRLLRPITLYTIQLLYYSGWDIDRIFRVIIQNLSDLLNDPDITDSETYPAPKKQSFSEISKLLRYFQKRGELRLGVRVDSSKEKQEPEELGLQIGFPANSPQATLLAELFGCTQNSTDQFVKNIELGFNQAGGTGLIPRSILSCMTYLSHGVQVPQEHLDRGIVKLINFHKTDSQDWEKMFGELFTVHWSYFPPKHAFVSVKYLDHWFYIDDNDLSAKKTFSLLLQLYNLNADAPQNRGPILTLPIK